MCKFTYTFYECGHRTEDNVRGCSHYKTDGVHCDVDNPTIKRSRCEVDVKKRNGFCPRCMQHQRLHADEAALQRDIEKAKRLDAEEQERNRKAHEAHLRKVQKESYRDFQSQEDETLARVLKESRERAERHNSQLGEDVLEKSSEQHKEQMEEKSGPPAEDGSTHPEAVKHKSSVDLRHGDLDKDANSSNRDTVTELGIKMGSIDTSGSQPPPPPPPPPLTRHATMPRFPPPDYSQPPKDQNYGRFKIGTRHQPIHPSQDLDEPPAAPSNNPPGRKDPMPSARLAGIVAPEVPAPVAFAVPSGDQRSRLRPTGLNRRSTLESRASQEESPNELEAQWSKRGIQREADEEEGSDSTSSIRPSQSASQVEARPTKPRVDSFGEEEDSGLSSMMRKHLSNLDQKRRKGWNGE
ncbi:unnamed protein product [Periconia digitata]|uniref:Uncharacterized protein n=1 Tax=Periconia digitata TaxID=1303443 RepID=A0A9W4UIS1_9PLEO|nr:unnamed protein product [Periconia digitata]